MTAKQSRRFLRWGLVSASIVLEGAFVYWRGHVLCYLGYPECSPFVKVAPMPDWNVPTNPQERRMYDFAHALRVPDGVAAPVPFDFRAARLADLYGGKSVGQQYFEHLCATEDGEYIFRQVKDVDGFQIMRPRGWQTDTPADKDRYGIEEPVSFGWFDDDDQLDEKTNQLETYVQPLAGIYQFVEFIDPAHPDQVVRWERTAAPVEPEKHPYGIPANWNPSIGGPLRVPMVRKRRLVSQLQSEYGYIWRGMRRPRDREFGIAGAEYFILDLKTNEVLAYRRSFKSTYNPQRPGRTYWTFSRRCNVESKADSPIPRFIKRVLHGRPDINDAFVPARFLDEYHQSLMEDMESHLSRDINANGRGTPAGAISTFRTKRPRE